MEKENLAHLCFRDVSWLQENPLNTSTAMNYFSLSPFYDNTCNNEQLRMQSRFNLEKKPENLLLKMVGEEYCLWDECCSADGRLFVIRKQRRSSPTSVKLLGAFYILDGSIYESPNLYTILGNRMANSMFYLRRGLELASEYIHYEPKASRYLCIPTDEMKNGHHFDDKKLKTRKITDGFGMDINDSLLSKMISDLKREIELEKKH